MLRVLELSECANTNKAKRADSDLSVLVWADGQFSKIDLSNSPNCKHKILFTKSMEKHLMLTYYAHSPLNGMRSVERQGNRNFSISIPNRSDKIPTALAIAVHGTPLFLDLAKIHNNTCDLEQNVYLFLCFPCQCVLTTTQIVSWDDIACVHADAIVSHLLQNHVHSGLTLQSKIKHLVYSKNENSENQWIQIVQNIKWSVNCLILYETGLEKLALSFRFSDFRIDIIPSNIPTNSIFSRAWEAYDTMPMNRKLCRCLKMHLMQNEAAHFERD